MAQLKIRLLGGLDVSLDGKALTFPTRHSASLVACLVMAPDMRMARVKIIELLWPDRAEEQARATLRQTLYRLKPLLGDVEPPMLTANRRDVWLGAEYVWSDVAAFKNAIVGDVEQLAEAFALYGGELFEGYGAGGDTFEAWLMDERIELRKLARNGFSRLAAYRYADRRFQEMETTARKLVAIDPMDEGAHRLLLAAFALQDERNAALAAYKDHCGLLRSELGVDPESETEALSEAIRDGGLSGGAETTPEHAIEIGRLIGDKDSVQARATAPRDPLPTEARSALPAQPLVAVLPFDNMSADNDQEYFADAITEDLITALSRVGAFDVISRNSTFAYRGQATQIRELNRQLGAQYVIEGSVRRAGDRVRMTVQLIDAERDSHIWADRYDRDVGDIFALQDEFTETVVGAIEPELGEAQILRANQKPTENLSAWDCYHRAMWHFYKIVKEEYEEGLRLLTLATELDPTFGRAFGTLATAYHGWILLGYEDQPDRLITKAVEAGRRAVVLDSKDPHNHYGLGRAYTLSGDFEGAVTHFNSTLAINPSYAPAHNGLSMALTLLGQPELALEHVDAALRLSPRDPLKWTFQQTKALVLYQLRRYAEAADVARESTHHPAAELWSGAWLAASLAQLGRIEEAKVAIAVVLEKCPHATVGFLRTSLPWRETSELEHAIAGFIQAGLPE